jgi:hypothetical protein
MGNVDSLEAQKQLWGHEGHGIPGANPNYSSRVRFLAAAGVLIVVAGTFAFLAGSHTLSATAARYIADVKKGDTMQSQFEQSLHNSPAKSLTIVRDLAQTLRKEDRRLLAQRWPGEVKYSMELLVSSNQDQISVLGKYALASPTGRAQLLNQQSEDANQATYADSTIRSELDANPVVT